MSIRELCLFGLSIALLPVSGHADGSEFQLSRTTEILASKGALRPQWSPDGQWIIFDDLADTSPFQRRIYKIYRIHPDGTGKECLTCDRPEVPGSSGGAQIDRSGRYVLFSAEKEQHWTLKPGSSATDPGGGIFNDLAILDLQTRRIHRLNDVGSGLSGQPAGGTLFPRFSHTGTRIAWGDYRGNSRQGGRFGDWRVLVADFVPDPLPHIRNIRPYMPLPNPDVYEIQGFTPDDRALVLSCAPLPGQDGYALDICQMDLATGQIKQLTFTSGVRGQPAEYEEHAELSPDGAALAFMSSMGQGIDLKRFFILWLKTDLWLANADGTQPRQISYFNVPGHPEYNGQRVMVSMLSWAPDASALVASVYYVPDLRHLTNPPAHLVIYRFDHRPVSRSAPR